MTPDWFRYKATCLRKAWTERFGTTPSTHHIVLALSVAVHETHAGDSWPGCYNWGATTLRALNAAEKAAVKAAGLTPTVGSGHEARAKAAEAAIYAAGLSEPHGEIHCDSAPTIGAYFCWFFKGADDVEGASYFAKLLSHGAELAVLTRDNGTEYELAAAMYACGYYTGFHKRDAMYDDGAGGKVRGAELNVRDYANSLRAITPSIWSALKDWSFPPLDAPIVAPPPPMTADGWKTVQAIVGATADGIPGPKTYAAIKAWKVANGLPANYVWDDDCRAVAAKVDTLPPAAQPTEAPPLAEFGDWRPEVVAQVQADELANDTDPAPPPEAA